MKQAPTHIRYLVVGAASVMAVLLYLDRFCISIAEIYIQQDLGLSDEDVGWMLSAFFWTYALGQVPAGWLTDRFGSRLMLTIYILLWSLFTGLTGAAAVFAALLFLRFGFGFSQAGAYPTAASIVSKWVPFQARGRASGVVSVGGRIGGFLALLITGHVLIWFTPASTPTLFEASDLLDIKQMSVELAGPVDESDPSSELRSKVFAQFSTEAQSIVTRLAVSSRETGSEAIELSSQKVATEVLPPDDVAILVGELNGIVGHVGFFSQNDLRGVPVEKEVDRAMRLSDRSLTEQETRRTNRLILESLHRKSLKKLYVAGWRPMMVFYGSLGIIVAAFLWWSTRNVPSEHPLCNAAEVALIAGDRPTRTTGTGAVGAVPIVALISSVSMWLCCISQWFTNIGWVFLMTWRRDFMRVHQVSVEELAWMVSIPPLVGWLGMVSGGAATDSLVGWLGLRWGRALPLSLSRFVAMAAYLACLTSPSPWFAVAMFSIVAFSTDFGTTSIWAFNQDIGGRHVGSVLGWGNMWGNLGAAVTPPLLIVIVGKTERWDLAFLTCAGAFMLSGIAAAGVNATIPIVSDDA